MDLNALPITHQATVLAAYLDEMEHMNVMWYVHLFDRATWAFFASFGMDLDYFEREAAGAFALEQHIRYLAEARLGQRLTIRTRALGRTAKRIHFMHFMSLTEDGTLAATTELLGIHIDRQRRRSAPMPAAIAAALDRILTRQQRLAWTPPLSDSIRL